MQTAIQAPEDSKPDVMLPSEAAKYLRIHQRTLVKQAEDKKIPGTKIGRQWRFSRKTLTEFV